MGYTQFSIDKIEGLIQKFKPRSVIDLGAQNLFNQPKLPAPYASEWYEGKGINYRCIDINRENNALPFDLSKEIHIVPAQLLVDCGTSEHVSGENSTFGWEAIYQCWLNKHNLLRVGYPMYSENPKTENWPGHGRQYYTKDFYAELAALTDYEILELGEHAAMGNITDGYNIYSVLRKKSERFPTLEQFKGLSLKEK